MRHVRTISFKDMDSGDEAAFIIRGDKKWVALGATLKENGDITVVFTVDECKQLIRALEEAINM